MTYKLINDIRYYEVEQGSLEWFQARMGIPTSSRFGDIVTPARGEPSKSMDRYANELVQEILQGFPDTNSYVSGAMERGKTLEEEAADQYEFIIGEPISKIGFMTDKERRYGASPDRLVGDMGSAEIKCFEASGKHVSFMLDDEINIEHKPQVQGHLLVMKDRDWVDWFAYHTDMPPVRIRAYRDEAYIKKLAKALEQFSDIMNEKIEKLISKGYMRDPRGLEPSEMQDVYMAG